MFIGRIQRRILDLPHNSAEPGSCSQYNCRSHSPHSTLARIVAYLGVGCSNVHSSRDRGMMLGFCTALRYLYIVELVVAEPLSPSPLHAFGPVLVVSPANCLFILSCREHGITHWMILVRSLSTNRIVSLQKIQWHLYSN